MEDVYHGENYQVLVVFNLFRVLCTYDYLYTAPV